MRHGTKRRWASRTDRRRAGLTATLVAAIATLVVGFPTTGGAAATAVVDLTSQSSIVVETWQVANLPNDPNRCVTPFFVEFPAVPGAQSYTAVIFNQILQTNQTFSAGPSFPYDSYTLSVGGQSKTFVSPGGRHRILVGENSSGSGCQTTPRFSVVSVTTNVANPPPVAAFTWKARAGASSTIDFDASSSTDDESIATYAWDFGDGSTSTGQAPSHPFASPGQYSVQLTVTDNEGATDTETQGVSVGGNEPPRASFTWRASESDALTIEFDATASTDDKGIEAYAWDFGDGKAGTGKTTTNTYDSGGRYAVKLTVTDSEGKSDALTLDVDVAICRIAGVSSRPDSLRRSTAASSTVCPLVVNDSGDRPDPDVADGRCDVDPNVDDDQCTLRAAIQEANGARRPGADTIVFAIAGTPEIVLTEPLPAFVGPGTIDGSTQAGVTVDAAGGVGLVLGGSGATVRKLAVVNASTGVRLAGGGGHTLDGVLAGVTWGDATRANALGVWATSDGNTLQGVVASGNSEVGILIEGADNRLEAVVAGLTSNGAALAPNGLDGLLLRGNGNKVVGGVFTGNRGGQLTVQGEANQISGVIAGLSGDGSTVVPGQTRTIFGIGILGGAGNVVTGAKVHGQQFGVLLAGGRGHTVERSRVTGASIAGVAVFRSAVDKVADNVIADADGGLAGILVSTIPEGGGDVSVRDPQPTEDNLVQSNVVGGDGIGNPTGVLVNGAARTVITGNWIAGNDGPGVSIVDRDGTPTGTVVKSNAIGLQFTGQYAPNRGPGVFVGGGQGATIGGTGVLDANLIAYNGGDGVRVDASAGGTRILGNQIIGNFGLGIDSAAADSSPLPTLLRITPTRADVQIRGASGSTHRVELFVNDDCDPSGSGEGASFLVAASVSVGANGLGSASIPIASPLAAAAIVTATSTAAAGSTSEFSACAGIAAAGSLTARAAAGATRVELDSSAGLVGKVVTIGTGATAEKNYGIATGSLVLARPTRFVHAVGESVTAEGDTLFVSVDKAVLTRSSLLPDVFALSGYLRPIQGRSIACGDDITLNLNGSTVAQKVPGTKFTRQSGNRCVFVARTENGIGRLEIDLGKGTWNAQVVRRDLERLTNPVEVALTIGDDAGGESLRFTGIGAVWTYTR